MLDTLFWVVVGALVGWHIPAPFWAKIVWDKAISLFAKK